MWGPGPAQRKQSLKKKISIPKNPAIQTTSFIYHCTLKGQCHETDIFLESLNILFSTFCVWFIRSFKSCSLACTIINFSITSLTLLANFENAY
jgi:hypothetical protein